MSDQPKVVAALPGQGWVARCKVTSTRVPAMCGEVVMHAMTHIPVVAWLVYEDGRVVAVGGSSKSTEAVLIHEEYDFHDMYPPPPGGWSNIVRPSEEPKS